MGFIQQTAKMNLKQLLPKTLNPEDEQTPSLTGICCVIV